MVPRSTQYHAPSRALSRSPPSTTEDEPGRTAAVQGLYRDFKTPTNLTGQRVSFHPKLKRRALTEDRLQLGQDLAAVLEEILRWSCSH